ncbi:receptor-type tyrosine-protein phosphatase kappa [Plakobranchus ocellatus]|uniref:protein-tyrosine-phosphatase n=1 Tax=Plakobranchus ocellatus TaxID=259542 RepID=A0AAV4AK03_9GAST|nr:receptor-type tyrosine-protein phosphatase kappa [Plakobranchus ocellatus]
MFFFLARTVAAILILLTPITAQCYTNGRVMRNSGCRYKCHCEGNEACDRDTGVCQGMCDPQWFGSACQYASLNFAPSEQLAWLTDNDDGTCNDGSRPVQSITVRLDKPQRLSWVRVVVNERDHLRQFQLTYRTESSQEFSSCPGGRSAKVNDLTLDISCPTVKVVSELKLSGSGVTALCSLYISDGVNVALGQETLQSSTFERWFSSYAVDGDPGIPDSKEFAETCSHTPSNRAERWWRVLLSNAAVVFRIVIYNRREPSRTDDCCEDRLIGFTLEAFKETYTKVFTYTDTNQTAQPIYTVIVPANITDFINRIRISNSEVSTILTLCEVLVFGETVCPSGKFGLECERDCNCVVRQESCFVSTGGCPSGCAAGNTGEDCYAPCSRGSYGIDCNRTCSEHCKGNGNDCRADTGHCTGGCEAGYVPPLCDDQCPEKTFGQDCKENCSSACLDGLCHHETGVCNRCPPGYIGDYCDQVCPVYMFGDGCSQNCSVHCLDQLCDHQTGICDNCTMGRRGQFCEVEITAAQSGEGGEGGEGGDDTAVIGAIVGTIVGVVIVTIIVIFFVWRHRRNGSEDKRSVNHETSAATSSNSSTPTRPRRPNAEAKAVISSEEGPDSIYSNVRPGNTAVAVEDLRSYLHNHASDTFLKDQFESVPMANSYSQHEGVSAQPSKKNRYKNILPYDHSRVLLHVDADKKHEDYINASSVKGYNTDDFFIASQAPNSVILHDFVRMLWEKQVDRVVMLTNLIEDRKIKCTMYWPEDEEVTFGEIKVKLLTTKVFAEYTIRQMQLSKDAESPRTLTQFHFTAWPDKSVPDSPWGLVDFQQKVLASPGSGPLLVHCSAGVGRTGTFIALCHLLQEAEATGKMDFLSTLWRLRQDRMQMIQTLALSAVCVEETLESTETLEEDGYEKGRNVINKQKNRLNNILPKNAYMPELTCEVKTMDKYINAVLVPSLTKTHHNILTQLPLPSTVTDFWRLVTQYNVGLVVAFQTDLRHTDETIGEFLPSSESEPMRGAMFDVHTINKEEHRLWQELSVTVFKKKKTLLGNSAEQHYLTCLLCKNSTLDPETVVEYLKKVKLCKPSDQSRTLYMCRNGADQCGLMCVQSILLDKLEADQCLTVPLIVGAIKAIRPQVIPTVDEYMCLYQVLRLTHEASNVYGNLENANTHQPNRDATINKAASSSHANPAFQQEEPDTSLKSDVNINNTVSKEKPGIPKPQTGPVPSPRTQASNKPTESPLATATAAKNPVGDDDVVVNVASGDDTHIEMSRGDPGKKHSRDIEYANM